jgi:co-chaperonin GroES (HSP10)
MSVKFTPINNYLSLEMVDKANPLILIPDSAKKEYRWAKVLDTGPGVPDFDGSLCPPPVSKGDIVYIMAHGREFVRLAEFGGTDVYTASELDAMCILDLEDEFTMETKDFKIKPLGVYIEIEKVEPLVTASTILLPDSKTTPTHVGIVKSLGKGWKDLNGKPIEHQVAVGNKVAFNGYNPCVVDLEPLGVEDKRFLVMHTDIYGIIEEECSV